MDIYPRAKFSYDPSRGFFPPYARSCASKMFTRLFLQKSRVNIFDAQLRAYGGKKPLEGCDLHA